jgi:hypothetical protein
MDELPADPAFGQSERTIAAYLLNSCEGNEVAIRNAQGLGVMYVVTTIESISRDKGRLYTAIEAPLGGKGWYLKTGKHCRHPKGQSRLVEPTEEIRNFARQNPMGRFVTREVNLATGEPWAGETSLERAIQAKAGNRAG